MCDACEYAKGDLRREINALRRTVAALSPSADGVDVFKPRIEAAGLYDKWEAEFKPLLGDTARWKALSHVVLDQLRREKPVIVETGALREPGNWAGDGQSTAIWDWVRKQKSGVVFSVDTDVDAYARVKNAFPGVFVSWKDSVKYLREALDFQNREITLLYLDSYDYSPGKELNAAMHQVAELAAIWERLPSGCLVASDDNHSKESGKGVLLRRLLSSIGIEPEIDSYVLVWRKP